MDPSPEYETEEREIIKEQWKIWNSLIEEKGKDDEYFNIREYDFTIDRRDKDESLFTADRVEVLKLSKPLEDWNKINPEVLKSDEGEEWIQLSIKPKNPYHPKLGFHKYRGHNFYFTERLIISLSNHGRAFEATDWGNVLNPNTHPGDQSPYYSRLKRYPKPEEIQVVFAEEPEEEYTEPFQPLKGHNLERLDFLVMKVKNGDIIEFRE